MTRIEASIISGRVTVEAWGLLPRWHRLRAGETPLGEIAFGIGSAASYTDSKRRSLRMARVSLLPPEYRMWEGEQGRASAWASLLGWRVIVAFGGERFIFRPTHIWLTTWEMRGEEGRPVLTVRRTGWGQAEIVVHRGTDADLVAFAYYLFIIRRRAARRR